MSLDISTVVLPFVNEALRTLGLWAVAPAVVGVVIYELRRKLIAKDEEIAALHKHVNELQEKRLQDAREMIRVAESGTRATASRTESDQRFADLIESLLRRNGGHGWFGWRR